jgi:undecaprenyl-diphosphatase
MADEPRIGAEPGIASGLLRIIPLSLLLAVVCLFLFSWIADEMLRQETLRFDMRVRDAVHQLASPGATAFMKAVTHMGSGIVLDCVGAVLLWILVSQKKHRAALLLVVTAVGAIVLDGVLKLAFHRLRPQPFFGFPLPRSYSFPSGHALVSFSFYGMLAWIITRHCQERWKRVLVWTFAVALIALIGISRIYLGVHYPSDVIAGYLAAGVWVSALELLGKRWRVGKAQS